jgi:hypothetical protein
MPLTANRLTDHEKRTVLKMRSSGEMYKTISVTLGKTIPQLVSFVTWHKGRNNDKYITGTVSCGAPYTPTGRIMPPINPASGMKVIKLTPGEVEDGLVREYGDRLSKVKMPLADRQGVAATLFNGIY